jgi:hypothetical protein
MQANVDRDNRQQRLETAARAAFELGADRKLTDTEWTITQNRFLAFIAILRGWESTTSRPQGGNVEVICQPED